ncbi:hypothetical protein CrV_gp051 [Cylindrospermopsis raciborskii virus RM-2018a]|nr:hypothetical protein CrV_gp051 [Cylindrospermopsis raciborskii virus RM-2018a]
MSIFAFFGKLNANVSKSSTQLLDLVQQNHKPIYKYTMDVSEDQLDQMVKEAEELTERAERVQAYCQAGQMKVNAVRTIYESNAQLEGKTIDLAMQMHRTNEKLIPKRREFKALPSSYRGVGKKAISGNSPRHILGGFV